MVLELIQFSCFRAQGQGSEKQETWMRAEFRPQFRVLGGKSKASLFMFEPFQERK